MFKGVLFMSMSVYHMCTWCLQRMETLNFLKLKPQGYWKSNLGPVHKQLMLSTTEQPLQPIAKFFYTCVSQVPIVITNTSDNDL